MFHFHHVKDGKSPLMFAAECGYEMVILLLLDHGANINFKQEVFSLWCDIIAHLMLYVHSQQAELLCSLLLRMAMMQLLPFYWLMELILINKLR